MLKYLRSRPLLLCGIICAILCFLSYYSLLLTALAGIMLIGALIYFIKTKAHFATLLCCGLVILSSLLCIASNLKIAKYKSFEKTTTTATLTLCELVEKADYYAGVFHVNNSEGVESGIKIYAFMSPQNIKAGEVVTAEMTVSAVDEKYRLSNYSEGIYLNANLYDLQKTGEKDFVITAIEGVRVYIKNTLFKFLERSEASTVSALLFGEKGYFDAEFSTAVRRAGVSHVMVVSGMHLSVSVLFFAGLLSRIWYNRYFKAFTMLSVVLILTAVCGFSISILRAGITYIIMAILLMLNRKSVSENNLGFAVTVILLVNPLTVFSGAFWLSVLSTFGILCIAKHVTSALEQTKLCNHFLLYAIISAAIITLAATLMTLPVSVYLFGEFSVVGILTNLLISYAVTVTIWLSLLGVLFNLFLPFLADFLFFLTQPIVAFVNWVIKFFASLPFASVSVPKESALLFLAAIVFVFWLLSEMSLRKYNRRLTEKGIKIKKETRKSKLLGFDVKKGD